MDLRKIFRLFCVHDYVYVGSSELGYTVELCKRCGSTRSVRSNVSTSFSIGVNNSGFPTLTTVQGDKIQMTGSLWHRGIDSAKLIDIMRSHILNMQSEVSLHKNRAESLSIKLESQKRLIDDSLVVVPKDSQNAELYVETRRLIRELSSVDYDKLIGVKEEESSEHSVLLGRVLRILLMEKLGYDKMYDRLKWNIVGSKYIFTKRLNRKK